MTDEKRLAAEHLFDALGELDDSLLASALSYKKPKAKILTSRPFISSLSAVAAGCVGAIAGNLWRQHLDLALLRKIFGILFILCGIRELLYRPRKAR